MRFGVCRGIEDLMAVGIAAKCGFDYLEPSFKSLVSCDESVLKSYMDALAANNITCEATNCLLPGELKIVGNAVDYSAIDEHLEKGFERAKMLGVKTSVFGSGGSRSCEDGFSDEIAAEQVLIFIKEHLSPAAKKAGIAVAIEPLSRKETKMIHTVEQAVLLAAESGCDNIFALADIYHVANNEDDVDGIARFRGKLCHAHFSHPFSRRYSKPGDSMDAMDYSRRFLKAVKATGCERISVEAGTDDFGADAADMLKVLRQLTNL